MEPHNIKRGKSSGYNNQEVQSFTLHQANKDFTNVVTQGIPREKLHSQFQQKSAAATTTAAENTNKTMAREEDVEENGQGRTLNVAESQSPTTMYLVMPSYAEPYKYEIKKILQKEKATLCSNKTFQKAFENIDFNIAYTNSKNIKQLIVRTKI